MFILWMTLEQGLKKPVQEDNSVYELFKEWNSPENIKQREETTRALQEHADLVIAEIYWREAEALQNDMLLSCLRDKASMYNNYAESLKVHPEAKKYFQSYNYNGKNFLVVPQYNKEIDEFVITTVELGQVDWKMKIVWNLFDRRESDPHPYTRDSNVIPIRIADSTQQYWYATLSLNKRTWEISTANPSEYKLDEKGVQGLIDTIDERLWTSFSSCSEGLQSQLRNTLSQEWELKQGSSGFSEQKDKLFQCIVKGDFSGAVTWFLSLVDAFLGRKKQGRVIDLWKDISYEGDESNENDLKYLETSIDMVLDPEKRSELTYLLWKIKDKKMKNELKGIDNLSQFDLFLQQCKPWQIMLTNALDLDGSSSSFKYATQMASWWRWCHALLVSNVVRDSSWRVIDCDIVQSTLKWWVHEISLKKYISENYSSADLLLADLPENKSEEVIRNARARKGEKYDKISIVSDSVLWFDADMWWDDSGLLGTLWNNVLGKNKAYCSELVFDAMEKSWLKMPEPHMSPCDLLMTDKIRPQYACYCDKF